MTFDELHDEWAHDARLTPESLELDAINTPLLHGKWWKYYNSHKMALKKLDSDYAILYKHKYDWYLGKMDDETRKSLGWAIQPLKILKEALSVYINADADIIALTTKRTMLEEKLRFIESVIKEIQNRGFHIKNYVEFMKWKQGMV